MIQSLPVMLANGVTLVLAGAILVMKLKWGDRRLACPSAVL
jgi:uncharacterized protein with PQ loop repeat